jgi:hypothetical protein
MSRATVTLGAVALVAATAACLDDISGTRPLTFSMTADVTTATVGQTVTFSYLATGTGLRRVILDYGDGVVDTATYPLPLELTDQAFHAFDLTGTFTVRGEAQANDGNASQELTVTVN